jgi:chromate transporter
MSGLSVAQVLPGANPVNLSIYVGHQLRGLSGALTAVVGMVVPAFCVILLLGMGYRTFGHFPIVHFTLAGLAAAGVGATFGMGIRVAGRLPRNVSTPLIAAGVCVVVGVLRWPMIPVVAIAAPLSIALALRHEKRSGDDVS